MPFSSFYCLFLGDIHRPVKDTDLSYFYEPSD